MDDIRDLIARLTKDEMELVVGSWYQPIPRGELEPVHMQRIMDAKFDSSSPLASYVLNRTVAWLEGGERFEGDERLMTTWNGSGRDRSCVLTDKEDGAAWKVSWFDTYNKADRPAVKLSRFCGDGRWNDVAGGEITTGEPGSGNRHRFSNAPPPVRGTVEADIEVGAFDELCGFCDAVRGSMPEELLRTRADTVTFAHASRFEALYPILDADGGLPGRLCQAREGLVAIMATQSVCGWIGGRYAALAEGLREAGAEWGRGVLNYNDLDYSCCVIDMNDGVALFNDNAATCADQRAYVARFAEEDGKLASISVHVFGEDEDYQAKVEAIRNGSDRPDFVFDGPSGTPSFPGGRMGHAGMAMFFWQFMSDSLYALERGKLDTASGYWPPAGKEPASVPK